MGATRETYQEAKDAQARYLADNPDLAGYKAYTNLIGDDAQGFVEQTALENPGFAQFVRSSMMDHTTGEINYDRVYAPDAYLASQGVRPSVYSPVAGNEPSRVPGGYPALAGAEADRPLVWQAGVADTTPVYRKASDADATFGDAEPIAWIDPDLGENVTVLKPPGEFDKGMALVSVGEWTGYVDQGLLTNISPHHRTPLRDRRPRPCSRRVGWLGWRGQSSVDLGRQRMPSSERSTA